MNKAIISTMLCAGAVTLSVAQAQAQTGSIDATISGAVQSANGNGVQPFQIGPAATNEGNAALNGAAGQFLTYSSSGDAPAINGNDLSNYGFALYATSATDNGNGTADYSGTFRIYAPGYGYSVNDAGILEHGSFNATATFTDPYNALVSGLFTADPGFLQPTDGPRPWPVPVDFSGASPAEFTGNFSSTPAGQQTLTGRLTTVNTAAVPEPGTLPLLMLGSAALVCVGLRRRKQAAA
jgi:hypothetical protein